MSLLIISCTECKLIEQQKELLMRYNPSIGVKYLAFDYGTTAEMDQDGGIGLLINNIGTANETTMYLEEISDDDIELMI